MFLVYSVCLTGPLTLFLPWFKSISLAFQQSHNFLFISIYLFFICLVNGSVAAILCVIHNGWSYIDCGLSTSLIQRLGSRNILKIRWQWALLSHPCLGMPLFDGLLPEGWWEGINSRQDYPLTFSFSCTTHSLSQIHVLNARVIPHRYCSSPN